MKEVTYSTKIFEVDSINNLTDHQEQELCKVACDSVELAYAPYSKYKVGAAILLDNDKIVMGSNQENAVFPLGLCAERVAIFSSSSQYPNVPIKAIAIKTVKSLKNGEYPCFPCGSCRQCMIEMEYRYDRDMKIFVMGANGKVYIINSAKLLLPFAFNHKDL